MLAGTLAFDAASSLSVESSMAMHNLRATQQQLQFMATQQQTSAAAGSDGVTQPRAAYNWLTQSSSMVDTLQASLQMSSSLGAGFEGSQQSSLLFTTATADAASKRAALIMGGMLAPAAVADDVARLRRRFLKDKAPVQSKYFARKNVETREDEFKRQLKMKQSSHVEKYRQYRIGDFPDIQIKFCELIAPMQALAQRD